MHIQCELCKCIEDVYYLHVPNYLKSDLICQYLKDKGDIEWVDAYSVIMHEHGKPEKTFVTSLSYDLQLTMLMIAAYEKGKCVRLQSFIPWMDNLVWISKHCDMKVYVDVTADIAIDSSYKTLLEEDKIFDFVLQEKHYLMDWLHFKYSVLSDYTDEKKILTKEKEQIYFDKYLKEEKFLFEKENNLSFDKCFLVDDSFEEMEKCKERYHDLMVQADIGLAEQEQYNYYLYIILKKDENYYLYEMSSVDDPSWLELVWYHCLDLTIDIKEKEIEQFSVITSDYVRLDKSNQYCRDRYYINLTEWSDEILLFMLDDVVDCNVIDYYKRYGACIHYDKKEKLLHFLERRDGLLKFHEWYQMARPLRK